MHLYLGADRHDELARERELLFEDSAQIIEEHGTRHEIDLASDRTIEDRPRHPAEEDRDDDVGIEEDPHSGASTPPGLHGGADNLLIDAESRDGLFPRREDPIPAIPAVQVLPERLSEELAPGPALAPGRPLRTSGKLRRQGDRDGSRWAHVCLL